MQLVLLTYIVERFITFSKYRGKENRRLFNKKIKNLLDEENIDEAVQKSEQQQGALGNVMKRSLSSLQDLVNSDGLRREQKLAALKNDMDEAKHVEIPALEHNIAIISTIASVATLVGLLGTVLGMIKAFQALAQIGAPDSVGLANGISQALVTTALGIGTAAVGIIFYNYFSNKLDKITDAINEGHYLLIQHLKKVHPIEVKTKESIHA
jgi:biopolymer transport protein ExbB